MSQYTKTYCFHFTACGGPKWAPHVNWDWADQTEVVEVEPRGREAFDARGKKRLFFFFYIYQQKGKTGQQDANNLACLQN